MPEIKEVNNKNQWEAFLRQEEILYYPFFQSWNWGEVQKRLGFRIVRFGVFDSSKLTGVCQVVDVKAKRGHYFHLRHGPVFLKHDDSYFDFLIDYVKKYAKEQNASFLRVSPLILSTIFSKEFLKQHGAFNAPIHNMDAQVAWALDISKSEDELLKDMRKTHRYLIKKAKQMDIEIIRTKKVSDIDIFIKIYNDLSERKRFIPHSGIREEFAEFSKDDEEALFLAKFGNKIISGAIISFVGSEAIYRHGASISEYNRVPASYLLQWESILEAKKRKKALYNFWGIAKEGQKNHPWQGLTLFKTGFGGKQVEFVPAFDIPLKSLYWKTYVIDYITKWRKGY